MRVAFTKLKHLPVVTVRGTPLGHVADIELDAETHAITAYLVHSGIKPFGANLRIVPAEVVAITAERITVKDTAIPVPGRLAAAAEPAAS